MIIYKIFASLSPTLMKPRDNAFLKYYFFPVNHDFSEYYGLTHFHQPSAIYLLRTLDRTFFSKIRLFFDFCEISLITKWVHFHILPTMNT